MKCMEIKEMRCFLRVAETLSFKRAAELLNVSHSVATKTIAQLEYKIGTPLFTRTTRRVTLTPAGVLLKHETEILIRNLDRIQRAVRHETGEASGRFSIGVTPMAMQTFFPAIMREFRATHRSLDITVEEMPSESQIKGLLSAFIDVAFLIAPVTEPELEIQVIRQQPMYLAIPTCHAYYQPNIMDPVPLSAFATDTFLVSGHSENNGIYEEIYRACDMAGFRPKIRECQEKNSCLALVEAGMGVSFVTDKADTIAREGLALVELGKPAPSLDIVMAWRRDDPSVALQNIKNLVFGYLE